MSRTRTVTLMDIADHVGVSKATVARALSAKGYVADDVRARIEQAASELGYRPNLVAKGFRSNRSYTIGHVVHGMMENPFFTHVARSIEREALAHGYKVFLYTQSGTVEHEREGVERFIERRVDAVIFTYARGAENIQLLVDEAIPVVQIERDQRGETHTVFVDNRAGAQLGMQHLIELGHRRIAFIGGDPALYPRTFSRPRSVEEERLDAYREAVAKSGLDDDDALIRLVRYYVPGSRGENASGFNAMQDLLALDNPPTAVFIGCDVLAMGAFQAIYQARLRIPDDISVVGFDDSVATNLAPLLTTVAQPMAELGQRAFEFALAAIEDPEFAPQSVTLTPTLVIRDSTGPVPQSRKGKSTQRMRSEAPT
ncbi:LacI family transcriptional regulator [Pararobbsia alpina]|uniref:LacI family DNA-binding transcriptional regulator n=1 Tax=Pararobbsia alpina TaxID=621374 RepID=UPI0039A4D175